MLIAAAFLADPVLGWSTTLAIIAHEVPQEAGDFAILLAAGWKRSRALLWNTISSLSAIIGGIAGYYALDNASDWIPVIITLAASSFLYVAIADLMPRLKRETTSIGWHSVPLIAGIALVIFGMATTPKRPLNFPQKLVHKSVGFLLPHPAHAAPLLRLATSGQ